MGHYIYAVVLVSKKQWDRKPRLMSWNYTEVTTLKDGVEIGETFRKMGMDTTIIAWWVKDVQGETK